MRPTPLGSATARALVVITLLVGLPASAAGGLQTWTSAGPEGGSITVLSVDSRTPGVLYAGTFSGVFKSATSGSFWTPLTDLGGRDVRALTVDSRSIPATVYATTEPGGGGVYKSIDGGARWSQSSVGLPVDSFRAVAVDPQSPATVFVVGASGVFKSTNGGSSWNASRSGLPSNLAALTNHFAATIVFDPSPGSTMYLGTAVGVFKSTNGGNDWSPRNSGLGVLDVQALVMDPQNADTLYAGTRGGGVYKTTNGGASWQSASSGLTKPLVNALAIAPGAVYAGTEGGGIFKTTNGGATWNPASSGPSDAFVTSLAVDPGVSALVYAGTLSGGVFKSTDAGSSWSASNASLTATRAEVLALDPQSPSTVYSGGAAGVFRTDDGAVTWNARNSGLPVAFGVFALAIDPKTSGTLYAGTDGDGVYKSTDGGTSWRQSNGTGLRNEEIGALVIDPQNPAVLYAGVARGNVFKTVDGGASWSQTGFQAGFISVSALAIDPKTPATVYGGTTGAGVYKSVDGGQSWMERNTGLEGRDVWALAVDPQTPAILYAAVCNNELEPVQCQVFRSTNGGEGWSRSVSGLPDDVFRALAVDPAAPATIYAASERHGVFRSTNAGATWSPLNAGLTNLNVLSLAISPSGACLHAGTNAAVFDFATRADPACPPLPSLDATLSSTSQSVAVGTPAVTFATVTNVATGATAADGPAAFDSNLPVLKCGITQLTGVPTAFTFQAVDPTTNQPIGLPNTPVGIASSASQKFKLTLTPTSAICPLVIQFGINCSNTGLAPVKSGVNTLLLSAGSASACASSAALSASATLNQTTFGVGQTVVAGAAVTNAGLPGTAVDFYVGVLRPDNAIEFVTSAGIVVGNAGDPGSFRPLAVNVPLAAFFSRNAPALFTRQRTSTDPRGLYVFFVAAVRAGTLDQVLNLSPALYLFP